MRKAPRTRYGVPYGTRRIKMKCNECGRELIRLPFTLDDSEIADLELAMTKINASTVALKPDVVASYNLEDDKRLYAYFKAAFDELCEGRFLYTLWERCVRRNHSYEDGDLVVINGECFRHEG